MIFRRWSLPIGLVLLIHASGAFAQTVQEEFPASAYLPNGTAPAIEKMPLATGAFTHAFPIVVPSFRAIAPSLALSFSSRNSQNSFVGIGWTLSGIDIIERRGPNGSATTYTSADTYSYNGEPLVPFTGLGGTHSTKRQSFSRIAQSGDSWIITDKSGTKRILSRIHWTTRGTFRWGVTQVIDARGNQANYSWYGDGFDAYLDTITYNGNTISFGREGRSDVEKFSTGDGIGKTQYRLRSISVVASGTALRTYTLSYDTNAAGKSRLSQVAQSYLPNTTFSYYADPSGPRPRFEAPVAWWATTSPPSDFSNFALQEGDFNGDGLTDFCLHYRQSNTMYTYVSLSNGDGTFSAPVFWAWNASPPYNYLSQWNLKFGDFNGDGKLDFLVHLTSNGNNVFYFYVGLSLGNGTFTTPGLQSWTFGTTLPNNPICRYMNNYGVEIGDYNGDRAVDIRLHCRNGNPYGFNTIPSNAYSYVFLADRTGTFYAPVFWGWSWQTPGNWSLAYYGLQAGDYDGDGKTDFRFHLRNGSTVWSYTCFSLGNGSFSAPVYFSTSIAPDVTSLENYSIDSGDYNGDRRTDFRLFYRTAGSLHSVTFLSNGNGSFTPVVWRYYGYPSVGNWLQYSDLEDSIVAGDYDGDGTTDLIWNYRDGGGTLTYVAYSNADGTFTAPALVQSASGSFAYYGVTAGDYNGDGRTDLRLHWRGGGTINSSTILAGIKKDYPPLLSGIGYWTGGSTAISYTDHSSGKVLYQLVHADGRGGASIVRTFSFFEPYVKDPSEPRDIGFRQVRAIDAANHYNDTYFYQGASFPVGMPERVQQRNSSGSLMSETYFTVDQSGTTSPFVRLVTATDESECGSSCANLHTAIGYDGYGNVRVQTYQYGERTRSIDYYYDTYNYIVDRPTSDAVSSSGSSYSTTMGYNSYGELTSKTIGGIATTNYEYDGIGNQTKVTDPRSFATTTGYVNVYPTSTRNPLNHTTGQEWSTVYQVPISSTDVNSRTTTYGYDALGRKTSENRPDGSWTSVAYNGFGSAPSQNIYVAVSDGSSDGLWTRTYFDGLGRPYREEKKAGATKIVSYDARGLTVSETVDGATTYFDYDALGRLTLTTLPDGKYLRVAYDNWTATSTDELGYQTTRTKDAYGNVIRIVDPAGTTTLAYDAANHVTLATDGLSYQTSLGYDGAGRKTQMTDPNMGVWRYSYDAAGNVTSQTDARNQTITFGYDPINRLTSKVAGSTTLATLYYDRPGFGDSTGRLCRVTDRTGSTAYFYDNMGRVTQEARVIAGNLYNIWNTYDIAGRAATLTYPDGETISYSYDAGGRLTRVGNYATSGVYNARGQLRSRSLCNGVSETFDYDLARNWLTNWNSISVQNLVLGHNDRGDVTSLSGGSANWGYGYDGLGRLTSTTGPYAQSFSYGANSRMTSQTNIGNYSYGSRAHAPTSVGVWPLSYDANGNLTSGAGHSYTYDEENHVASVDGVPVQYNTLGERVRVGDTIFVGQLYEDNGSTQLKYYYFGKSRIARRDSPADVYYYHADQVGSVGKITNRARNVVKDQVVSPFGHLVSQTGTLPDPFALAGQRLENGLYPMGARYTDPELAMFVSPDLSGDPDPKKPIKLNRYAYAYQAPTKFIDPTGFAGEEPPQQDGQYHEPVDPLVTAMLNGSLRRNPLQLPQLMGESVTFKTGSVTLGLATTVALEFLPGFLMGAGARQVTSVASKALLRTTNEAAQGLSPFESVLQKISTLDFSTPPNKAIFYSGPGQGARAAEFAARTGRMTIEMTLGGRALVADPIFQSLSPAQQYEIWQRVSASFAKEASGEVHAFIRGAKPEGIFRTVEEGLLKSNPDVYKSIYRY